LRLSALFAAAAIGNVFGMTTIILNRKTVYREVWERPISKVAKEYGLSDRGLAKICSRLAVPTPPRGYWAKLESGQKPRIPALPNVTGKVEEAVEIRRPSPKPEVQLIPEPIVIVSDNLRGMHPLVKATAQDLSGGHVDTHGRLYQWKQQGLDVHVSRAQVKRALRIMNALVRKLEELGFSVGVGENGGREGESWVLIDGERVQVKLRELSRMIRDPKPDRYGRRNCTYEPTGRLELSMNEYVDTGSIKRVHDRFPQKPIEDRLGRFIVGLHACAQELRRRRREHEENQRQWEIARRAEAERVRLEAYRGWLREELVRQATAHQEARLIREFLAALESERGRVGPEEPDLAWLAWARSEAEHIDPVKNAEPIVQPIEPPEHWRPAAPEVRRSGGW
jgi:hypothetical protein